MLKYNEGQLARLVDDFVSGNEAAFADIIRLAGQDMVNIVFRYLGNTEDAKDVAQEIFVKLHRQLRSFGGKAKISTWLYRVAVNAAIDFLRARKKTVPLNEAVIAVHDDTRQQIAANQRQELVQAALAKLPKQQKSVFILKHFDGATIEQISKVLGCSPSSVKTHLYRAIESLRGELEGKI